MRGACPPPLFSSHVDAADRFTRIVSESGSRSGRIRAPFVVIRIVLKRGASRRRQPLYLGAHGIDLRMRLMLERVYVLRAVVLDCLFFYSL